MPRLVYDASSRAYFAFDVPDESFALLTELRWSPHMAQSRCWYTRSPYLAAPFWSWIDPGDDATRAALGTYAWNYASSFAKEPLQGTGVDQIRLPAGSKPYPFQIAGVQRIMMRKRILIADAMGLGKTLEALAPINLLRSKRILIGCPAAAEEHWAVQSEQWLVDPRSVTILGRGKRGAPDTGVLILPYSRSHNFIEQILRGPKVDYVVMDEAHHLKTATARRSGVWLGAGNLVEQADRVVALTGTPIPNHALEAYGLLRALAPETLGGMTSDKFKETYCTTFRGVAKVAKRGGGEVAVEFERNESRHEAALNAELRASGVMVRRLKEDVLDQLPPKHSFLLHLTSSPAIEELVREEATLYDMLETKLLTSQELIALQGHISNVRARLGVLKAPRIADYVKEIFTAGETHVVLFMLHLAAIEEVRKQFEGTRINVRVLTGGMSPRERQQSATEFQKSNGYELTIGQVVAAGEIITLTRARYIVTGELSWVPSQNAQCVDRVHRISQTQQVENPICTFPHAVEERVLRSNAVKAISAAKILDTNLQNCVVT